MGAASGKGVAKCCAAKSTKLNSWPTAMGFSQKALVRARPPMKMTPTRVPATGIAPGAEIPQMSIAATVSVNFTGDKCWRRQHIADREVGHEKNNPARLAYKYAILSLLGIGEQSPTVKVGNDA